MLDGSGGIITQERSKEFSTQVGSTSEQIGVTPQTLDPVKVESQRPDAVCSIEGKTATVSAANQPPTRASRQRGDLSIYTYWFRSIGWKYIVAFYASQVIIEASHVGSGELHQTLQAFQDSHQQTFGSSSGQLRTTMTASLTRMITTSEYTHFSKG